MAINRIIYAFQDIVNKITVKIGNTSTLSDFTPGSNILSIIEAFAAWIEFIQWQINIAFESFKVSTATGVDLDNRVQDYGMRRNPAVFATTPQTFYCSPSPSIAFTILASSQVSTQPDPFGHTTDFKVISDILFPSGVGAVSGMVQCTVAGFLGNVPANSITNITSVIPGVTSTTNSKTVSDGADLETDDALRARVPSTINGLKSANNDAIKAAVLAVPGITIANVASNSPAPGQVTVYVSNQSGILSADQYNAVLAAAQAAVAFCITASIVTPTISYVTITADVTYDSTNYDPSALQTTLKSSIFNLVLLNTGQTLQIIDLATLIRETPGILNVRNVLINGSGNDYSVAGFNAIRLLDQNTSTTLNMIAG